MIIYTQYSTTKRIITNILFTIRFTIKSEEDKKKEMI